ncbi:MAG: ABC-2 family transporter protein [Gemmatimonadota bacterium]|nr:ABC-2 family transporter protein [Gemmatimonadota bacterium]
MRNAFRLYFRYVTASVRGQMQYRASFMMLAAGYFLMTGLDFAALWVLFDHFGSIEGWTLPEVALLYGMVNIAFAIAEGTARGFDTFGTWVKSGEFDRLLLRPRSTVLQLAGQELHLLRIGRLLQGLGVLLWAQYMLEVAWTAATAVLAAGAILGGVGLFIGIFILQATLAFWTTEGLEIANVLTNGGTETAQYPLVIYPRWFRRFFTYVVPLAGISYFPALAILDRADPLGSTAWMHWLSPLGGMAFLLIALRVWSLGVRHYRSTGS